MAVYPRSVAALSTKEKAQLLPIASVCVCGRLPAPSSWCIPGWKNLGACTYQALLADAPQQSKERVVLFVLDNHLDRSERLLVQLNHAGAEEEVGLPLQAEARQLLVDNRLYRQSVAQNNDPLLGAALDHLERVLVEVANSPDELNRGDIARIEEEMNTQGLLFQIRVLRTKVSEQQTNAQAARKGATL